MPNKIIEGYRLSPQQKHLWSLQQLETMLPYRAQCALLVEGNLNLRHLETALQEVVNRHEILRTNFRCLPGMTFPLQVISDHAKPSVHHHDLSGLDSQKQDIQIKELFDEVLRLPLNLEQGLLLHASLITLSQEKHILLISLPALCADSTTIKNLALETSYLYLAVLRGENLSDEPIQYADVAEWQNELLESENTKIGVEYWQRQDFTTAFNLKTPFENKFDQKNRFKPQVVKLKIESDLVLQLEVLMQKYEVSISVFLLACWQTLLRHLTGQQKIVVTKAFNGRKYEELEKSLGLLTKYLPLTCYLDGQLKFSDLLKQVKESMEDAYKWQEYFDCNQTGELNRNQLESAYFPFCFEFEEQSQIHPTDGLSFSVFQQYVCSERFKVKLSGVRQNNSLTTEFHYDSALFNQEAIKRLSSQFQTLLESAVNFPEAAIRKLKVLGDRERHQLLVEFNQTQIDYPKHQCIHQLFEQQVKQAPNDIALVFENQQLSYAELNARANRLAHYLRRRGVKPEVLVGLFVERSLEWIIGFLGILKAGGAYLPLDPSLPKESLAFRLQDAQVSVLLTQKRLEAALPESIAQVVCIDSDWSAIARESQSNPTSEIIPENLAYVLYTSGSTGQPKGVAVEHQQLLNYYYAISERLDLSSYHSFATVSTFAADLGNTSIFSSLCSGGCLHVVSQERAANPETLADYFHCHPIDCLKIVPSHLAALLTASHPEQILPRQRLILGGEACRWNLIEQLESYAPECDIFNHYGPTETTIGALTHAIERNQSDRDSETVPIGRAIANSQIYLLDSDLQPVPLGVPGEVYIGGAGLTRGYLNQPALTAERFIPHPFAASGQRLYQTGDLARYRSDGSLEFFGRIDHQVKIHGFRIELGEIEAALTKSPAIRETAVLALESQAGNKRLVAYVVPKQDTTPTTRDLRDFLQEKLPEYMMPSAIVQLKALPLTPNGKVDRQALPDPETTRCDGEGTFVEPRTPAEKILAEIWTHFLKLDQVDVRENFFELGGDSILSMQIIAKARQAGLQLTSRQLFEYPTIGELAAVVDNYRAIQAEQGLVTGQVPLTPIQHWFFEQELPDSHHWNQSVLLEVRQALDPTLLEETVRRLLEHHDALRLRFFEREMSWQQIDASPDDKVPFTQLDLSAVPEIEQESAILAVAAELQTSLDLSSGPLVRVALFELGSQKPSRLLIVIHHLAVDGVSWRILLEDLQAAYQQLSQGERIQLPPKTTSFKQWSQRLQAYAHSEEWRSEQNYWLSEFHKQVSPLPAENPEGRNTVADARTVSVELTQEETQTLLQQVPAAYQTQINEVLLTALVQAFKQWTGERSVLVELEGHGREEIFEDVDLSRTVGWFTTIFPVLLDIEGAADPGDALKAVKEQLRRIPNRGIGYGVLRYLSENQKITDQLQAQPQAQIRFNYLGQSDQVFQESSLFAPAPEASGSGRSLQGNRRYLLDINGIIAGGQLRLDWTYSQAVHRQVTVESFAQHFIEALRSLITHCQSPEAGIDPSSDFPRAKFSKQEIEAPLVPIQPQGFKKPFFMVHPIGGNVFGYHKLAHCIGREQPFYGLQALGLYGECEPYTCVEEMASHYIAAIRTVQPEEPYFLGGWSMGGLVAFEMAQQLQRQGHQVALLTLMDERAPATNDRTAKTEHENYTRTLANFANNIANSVGKDLSASYEQLQKILPGKKLSYVLDNLQRDNLVSPEIDFKQFSKMLKVYQSNLQAKRQYVPQNYSNQLILFRARDSSYKNCKNTSLGWNKLSSKPIETITVPGNHHTMFAQPNVWFLAEQLSACINRVQLQ
jgi:amino acid adenylation domain-containing protein/non-ribosomal peptide synthase protein (TIGR01720 family)